MKLEKIWDELLRTEPKRGEGLLRRRLLPEGAIDLFAAVKKPANARLLQLTFRTALPSGTQMPECRGLLLSVNEESDGAFLLSIAPASALFEDLYALLCDSLVTKVERLRDEGAATLAIVAELQRWQHFLESVGPEGLSTEGQQGLFGELKLLDSCLGLGPPDSLVRGWTGPGRGLHDFEFLGVICEVKTVSGNAPFRIYIPSEKQLDPRQGETLLYCLALTVNRSHGVTLVDAVERLREALQTAPQAAHAFEDGLFRWGYHDIHAPLYGDRRYLCGEEMFFRVEAGFPCLTSTDIPNGVGDVHYSITLDACRAFSLTLDQGRKILAKGLGYV